jgi:histidinol dehydrogenase
VDDFVKIISVFALGEGDLRVAGPPAVTLARAEGLEAHARAVECRLRALEEAAPAVLEPASDATLAGR